MPEIVILTGAEREILEAYVYLEDLQAGFGDRFALRVEETLSLLKIHPESGAPFRQKTRRRLVRGFPYGIFYIIESKGIIIQTVLDLRQSPDTILRRPAFFDPV